MTRVRNTGAMRRVGVIGDVHTEDVLLERAVAHLKQSHVDSLWCVGDIVDGPNREVHVDRCCAILQRESVLTVCGNHDRWAAEGEQRDLDGATLHGDLAEATQEFLNQLPQTLVFDTPAGRALLCHGLEGNDMASVKPFDRGTALSENDALQAMLSPRQYDFVINGHTHQRMVRALGGLTVINAGTLHRDHQPGFLIVDFAERAVELYDFKPDSIVLSERIALADSVLQQ